MNPKDIKSQNLLRNYFKKAYIYFNSNSDCKGTFEILKNAILSHPIIMYLDFEEPLLSTTDASAFAIRAVLSQGSVLKDLLITFASKTLYYYSTTEVELLKTVWAVKNSVLIYLTAPSPSSWFNVF